MKVLFVSMLLVLSAFCCFAQRSATVSGSGLVVLKKEWHTGGLENPALNGDWDRQADDAMQHPKDIVDNQRINDRRREQGLPPIPPPQPKLRPQAPANRPRITYSYSVKVRNESAKGILELTLQYVFKDPATGKEVGRRTRRSEKPIGKGDTQTVSWKSEMPPTGTINSATANTTPKAEHYKEEIVIVSVKFTDGSTWKP